jgi:hypothetical protein
MSNPRVESLLYRFLSLDDRRDFSQAGAWEGDVGGFDCRLDGGDLKVRPQAHYLTSQRAREALEPHLRAWELWAELEKAMRIQFKYGGSSYRGRSLRSSPGGVGGASGSWNHDELRDRQNGW